MSADPLNRVGDFEGTPYGTIGRRELRVLLCEAQNWRCCYCGIVMSIWLDGTHGRKRSDATIEHLTMRANGGEDRWENCVAACQGCNSSRPPEMGPHTYWWYRQSHPVDNISYKPPARFRRIPVVPAPEMPIVTAYLKAATPAAPSPDQVRVIASLKKRRHKPKKERLHKEGKRRALVQLFASAPSKIRPGFDPKKMGLANATTATIAERCPELACLAKLIGIPTGPTSEASAP